MKKGYFLTFEGPEGSGKSTMNEKIAQALQEKGYDVVITREPGGIDIAEQIRKVILDVDNTKMDKRTEALLYAAARRQHLVEKVIPALAEGKIVLCDRFVHSSLAYQGVARGIGVEEVMQINEFAIEGYMPDAVLYFDIEPALGLERIAQNSEREINRLDKEALSFHKMVRSAYLDMQKKDKNMVLIDASQSIENVFAQTMHVIENLLEK